jgi:hypothetical protein
MEKDTTNVASLGLHSGDPVLESAPAGASSHVQWGAILAGSLAGFAATIIMTTLGAAIGATTGAAKAEELAGGYADPETAATVAGVGMAVWTLLTAVVVGFVGGSVLNRMARYDRPYMPSAFGALTWTGGVALAMLLLAQSGPGLAAVAAGGAAGAAGMRQFETERNPINRAQPRAENPRDERQVGMEQDRREMTPDERAKAQDAAKKAATGTAGAAWLLLGAQLVSLASTMLAARWRKAREIPVKHGAVVGPRVG